MNFNKILSIALSSSFLWGQFVIEQAIAAPIVTTNWKTLNRNNYTLKYPQTWELQQSENTESGTVISPNVRYQFAVLSQLESNQDKFRENVNLVIEDLNGRTVDLATYSQVAADQLKLRMKNCKILEHKITNKGSRQYDKIVWTWDYETVPLKLEQYAWLLDGKVYILTFTIEQSKFSQFQQIGEKILNTFVFK